MGEKTNIEWADDTHNFWRGCAKVSPGCTHCYAETLIESRLATQHYEVATSGSKRSSKQFYPEAGGAASSAFPLWGKGAPRIRAVDFNAPLRWNRHPWVCDKCGTIALATNSSGEPAQCASPHTKPGPDYVPLRERCWNKTFHRRRVFSLSLGDWLDDEVPIEWLADMLCVIHDCSELRFLLLTKRPENWRGRCEQVGHYWAEHEVPDDDTEDWLYAWLGTDGIVVAPDNVWVGVSVEDQQRAVERIPQLLKIPAAVRFLSVEPLLGPVNLTGNKTKEVWPWTEANVQGQGIDWVICGGESGPGARPCNLEWIRDIVRQCRDAGVPVFVKQDSGPRPGKQGRIPDDLWKLKQFPNDGIG